MKTHPDLACIAAAFAAAIFLSPLSHAQTAAAPPSGTVVNGAPATIANGSPVTLAVTGSSMTGSLSYQWQLNGTNLPGATGPTYTLEAAGAADGGDYTVVLTDANGATSIDLGTMAVTPTDASLVNFSALADIPSGGSLDAGFVVASPSGDSKSLLVRGVGPSLQGFGISAALAAPELTIWSGSSAMASNAGWGGSNSLLQEMNALGAFPLNAYSLDAAIAGEFDPGVYTAQVSGAGTGSGVAMAEVYDADSLSNQPGDGRLVNFSASAAVGVAGSPFVTGFVIGAGPSGASETVLLRAIGPALAQFGVSGVLSASVLTVYDDDGNVVATNAGWSNPPVAGDSAVAAGVEPASAAVTHQVGAFSLTAGSGDSALVATLPPGIYSVEVSSPSGGAGNALAEIYEVR